MLKVLIIKIWEKERTRLVFDIFCLLINACSFLNCKCYPCQAKVRARLSRPLQRGKGKHISRGDFRSGRPAPAPLRGSWARSVPRSLPQRGIIRRTRGRIPPVVDRGFKRPAAFIDRRPAVPLPPRVRPTRGRPARPVAPLPRSYDRRPPGMLY